MTDENGTTARVPHRKGRGETTRNTLTFRDKEAFLIWCRKRAIRPTLADMTTTEIRKRYREETGKPAPAPQWIRDELNAEKIRFAGKRRIPGKRDANRTDERRLIVLAKAVRIVTHRLQEDYAAGSLERESLREVEDAMTGLVARNAIEDIENILSAY